MNEPTEEEEIAEQQLMFELARSKQSHRIRCDTPEQAAMLVTTLIQTPGVEHSLFEVVSVKVNQSLTDVYVKFGISEGNFALMKRSHGS